MINYINLIILMDAMLKPKQFKEVPDFKYKYLGSTHVPNDQAKGEIMTRKTQLEMHSSG